jgi:hemerythrin-like domain-containing protein
MRHDAAMHARAALHIIQQEHQVLSAMLRSLTMLLRRSRDEGVAPPFDVLRAMLLYVDEFPERLHHPKESALLFPAVRRRCPELAATIAQLEGDHQRGEASIRELEHRLLAWEVMGASRRRVFETAAERYVENYLRHMALEESAILPAARQHLTDADWAELDAAFEANRDPLTGHAASDDYAPLFRKIVDTAPAPIGLG